MKMFSFLRFRFLISAGFLFALSGSSPGAEEAAAPEPPAAETSAETAADNPQDTPQEPSSPALIAQGIDLFAQGDADAACDCFGRAQKLDPALAPAGVITALLFKQRGDIQQAHIYLDRAVKETPGDPEPWYRLAELAADEKRMAELGLLLEKGDALLAAFLDSDAGKSSPRAVFLKSESISVAARAFELAGDLAASESKMREYIKLNPQAAEGYLSLGFLLLEQEKLDGALAQFSRAKEVNPLFFAGWLTAASLLDEKGKHAEAEKLVDEHQNDPDLSPADLSRLARLQFRWGRLADAQQTAGRIPPETLDRLKWDALLAYTGGDPQQAEKIYRQALRSAPDDFESLNGLALALAEQGKNSLLGEAFEKADRLHRKHPLSDEAAGTLAWIEFHRGNIDRAEDILLPILDRGGLTPTSAFYLACAAVYRKNNDLAFQLLTSSLADPAFFPKRSEAEKLLDSLGKTGSGEGE